MTFLAPIHLWWLLAAAVLLVAYLLMQRRRTEYALRFSNLALLEHVVPQAPAWRRHVPAALFLLTIIVLILALARPAMDVQVPRERATILVAIDVSPSMAATDVAPDRLTSAKESAQSFIESLPPRFNVGLVAFSSVATVVASPTQDHQAVADSIANLTISSGTAIGEGVFASLQAIRSFDEKATDDPPPAAIVLLSDGENTSGRPVAAAADEARAAGVPVSTIAFGTGVSIIEIEGHYVPANIDKETLKELAMTTGGRFYEAESTGELKDVYADIGSSLGTETVHKEIVVPFVVVALVLATATAVLSLAWSQRLP